MFNYTIFLHLSLMPIVVEHVVLLLANLPKTTNTPCCIPSDGQHHSSFRLFPALTSAQLVFDTWLLFTSSTGLRHFAAIHSVKWSSTLRFSSLFQLVSPTSSLYPTSTGLFVKRNQCFKLNTHLTYNTPKIACIFLNCIISKLHLL